MISRQTAEIYLYGEVIARFRSNYIRTIFSFEDLLCAVLKKLFVAFNGDGDNYLGFRFGGREVESDAVEIGDHLIYGYLRCAAWDVTIVLKKDVSGAYPEKRSVRRDCISTFW